MRLWFSQRPSTRPAEPWTYVRSWQDTYGLEYIETIDGVDWVDAPVPPRKHRCWPQMRAFMKFAGSWDTVYRCACGAISNDRRYWMDRNSRTAVHHA